MAKKGPGGRPSLYKPEYCERLVTWMSEGNPFETFGTEIGVCRDTLYEWATKHPEFSYAKKRAHDAALKWWMTLGKGLATNKIKGNSAVWIFTMKNMFHWKDSVEMTQNVNIDGIVFDNSDE